MADYPLPFLSPEEARKRMEALGFIFDPHYNLPIDGQEKRFQALQELIAGAIAFWSDARPEGDDETWEHYNNELNEFAQEYLVG